MKKATSVAGVPAFQYPGGKHRILAWLLKYIPLSGRRYIEPFAGRGSVFFGVASFGKFESYHLNDIATAPFFEALKVVDVSEIPISIDRTDRSHAHWKSRAESGDPVALAIESEITFFGLGFGNRGDFFGINKRTAGKKVGSMLRNIGTGKFLLNQSRAQITSVDYLSLPWGGVSSEDVAYFDPPYFGTEIGAYECDAIDRAALVNLLLSLKCRWVMSELESSCYERLGEPVARREIRGSMSRDGSASRRVECLWRNF